MKKPNRSQASIEQRREYSRNKNRELRTKNSDEVNQKILQWRKDNPEKSLAIRKRHELKRLHELEKIAGRKKPVACELCGAASTKINWDHDHSTGRFRGWLCSNCNLALGLVKDNIGVLGRMIEYITKGGFENVTESDISRFTSNLEMTYR